MRTITPRRLALALGLALFALYATTACPTIYWLDSSEFAAAAGTLGISHPPGHAATLLWGKLLALVPLGSIAFRVNLASAAAGAIAAAALFLLIFELTALGDADGAPGPRVRLGIAASATLLYALGYGAWLQSVRAEVYALEAALLLGTTALALRAELRGDRRALLAAGLLLGCGLANHHLDTLLLVLPVLGLALARPEMRGRPLLRALLFGVLGGGLLLYLPLRAARRPLVDWGRPDTWSRFFWVVSAHPFQKTAATRARFDLSGLGEAAALLLLELAVVPALLALLGLAALWSRRATRRAAGFLAAALLLNVGAVLLTGFDPQNPDAYGYLLPALGILAALAAAALAEVHATLVTARPAARRALAVALPLLLAAFVPVQALHGRRAVRLASTYDAHAYTEVEAALLPPRAALAAGFFETVFDLWYLQGVEGARPDVTVVQRGFLEHPGYLEDLARRAPDLAPLARAMAAADTALPPRELSREAVRRPVLVELMPGVDLEPPSRALPQLLPWGPFFAAIAAPAADAVRVAAEQRQNTVDALLARAVATAPDGSPGDPETARAVLWPRFVEARFECALGRRSAAARALAAARRIAPRDEILARLAQRCGVQ